jgi:hypothetical protein
LLWLLFFFSSTGSLSSSKLNTVFLSAIDTRFNADFIPTSLGSYWHPKLLLSIGLLSFFFPLTLAGLPSHPWGFSVLVYWSTELMFLELWLCSSVVFYRAFK